MKTEQKQNVLKNKVINNVMQNSSIFDIDEVNKAIELTRFNVILNIF